MEREVPTGKVPSPSPDYTDVFRLLLLYVLAVPIAAAITAWGCFHIWNWFIVSIFHVPALTWLHAIGIGLVLNYLRLENSKRSKSTDIVTIDTVVGSLIWKAVSVGLTVGTSGVFWKLLF